MLTNPFRQGTGADDAATEVQAVARPGGTSSGPAPVSWTLRHRRVVSPFPLSGLAIVRSVASVLDSSRASCHREKLCSLHDGEPKRRTTGNVVPVVRDA